MASTTEWPASDHPVVIERNHINVSNFAVLTFFTAAFPVMIDGNTLEAKDLVDARWIGFTLQPITTEYGLPYDEPVVPQDALGNPVRFPFEITNNTMIKTPGSTGDTLIVWGWQNYYNGLAGADLTDPDLGCRRFRESASYPWRYQCVSGDNGPVLISGNSISIEDNPGAITSAITLAWGDSGLNHAIVSGNTLSGTCYAGIRQFGYGREMTIVDNDLSEILADLPIIVSAGDTVVAYNVLGPVLPYEMPLGLPQPAVLLTSANFYSGNSPMPRPTESCVIMQNDYRKTGISMGAILLASRAETWYPTGVGTEVKNNVIFESGNFPPGTGGASNQVTLLNVMINPDTGLPYVHDNRIIGLSAAGLNDPGIGQIVKRINEIRKMLKK
jgi:hypothetical protein